MFLHQTVLSTIYSLIISFILILCLCFGALHWKWFFWISEMSISCFWTGDEANKAKRQFKIIKHILKAFMLRRTKALLIESGILALPPLTELTVYGSLFQEDIFPFLCALALSIFLICYEWFLQDGAADTVTKEALHVSVAERAANTYFIY